MICSPTRWKFLQSPIGNITDAHGHSSLGRSPHPISFPWYFLPSPTRGKPIHPEAGQVVSWKVEMGFSQRWIAAQCSTAQPLLSTPLPWENVNIIGPTEGLHTKNSELSTESFLTGWYVYLKVNLRVLLSLISFSVPLWATVQFKESWHMHWKQPSQYRCDLLELKWVDVCILGQIELSCVKVCCLYVSGCSCFTVYIFTGINVT